MEAGVITQIGVPGAFVLPLMDTVVLESKSKGGKDIATILDPKWWKTLLWVWNSGFVKVMSVTW